MKQFLTWLLVLSAFAALRPAYAQPYMRYEATWEELDQRPNPLWFDEAKFGVFIHWGVYSVAAYAPTEADSTDPAAADPGWYWPRLRSQDFGSTPSFHQAVYGPGVSYQDLAYRFKPKLFDPEGWARLFREAGVRYVVFPAKHHDGFAMWPSEHSWNWNSVDVGPHRDLLGEMTEAAREAGLRVGVYYSLYEWYNPLYRQALDRYVDAYMLPQMKELVDRYRPDLFWADGAWEHPSAVWRSEEFLGWLFNDSRVGAYVAVNDRWGHDAPRRVGGYYTAATPDQREPLLDPRRRPRKWEVARSLGTSPGFNRVEQISDFATSRELLYHLIDVVSSGGNFLLNIGPTPDGQIPVAAQQRLKDLGAWLQVNGEAIYGTRPWRARSESPDVRFTRKGNAVYAILRHWPGTQLVLEEPNPSVYSRFSVLGHNQSLNWERQEDVIVIDMPDLSPGELPSQHAYVLRMTGVN